MTRPDSAADDDALDDLLAEAVHSLRSPVAPRQAALGALKSALRAEAATDVRAPSRAERVSRKRWFTTPRALRVSPLTMLAAATLLIASTSLITARIAGRTSGESVALRAVPASTDRAAQVVRFTLAAPDARRVSLVGDFNGWDPAATALQEKDGTWTVVIPVTPGRHQYGFVIDGSRWIADPTAALSDDSDFGTKNSVMYVGG